MAWISYRLDALFVTKPSFLTQASDFVDKCQFYAAFKKYADRINTEYVAEMCRDMVQNYLKPTTPSLSTGVQTRGWCRSVGNQMAEVTKPNRNR